MSRVVIPCSDTGSRKELLYRFRIGVRNDKLKTMVHTTKLHLSGLTCGACEKVVMNRLKKIAGVQEVHVQVQNGQTSILASRSIASDEVTQALQGTHYSVIK